LQLSPPNGWTIDPEELDYEEEWAADDSIGQKITANYHLGKGRPVMYRPNGCLLMFEAGGKFYWWNRIDWCVYEIVSSTDLDEIITIMKEKGGNAVRSKECTGGGANRVK
jgi:hypothetical protein